MPRLIDADALKEHLSNRYMHELFPDWNELSTDTKEKIGLLGSTFKQAILNAPTIDAEPVRHSELLEKIKQLEQERNAAIRDCARFPCYTCNERENGDCCPQCRTTGTFRALHEWRGVCPENSPHCGAKMDGGASDGE